MTYRSEFKPAAVKDLEALSSDVRRRIVSKIEAAQQDLAGDVKRLTNFTPETIACCSNWTVSEW